MTDTSFIAVQKLWHEYEGNVVAVRGVDMTIQRGEFVALIGANGSGKTTLVKHFNGLLKPTRGSVRIADHDTHAMSVSQLSRYIGFVFQNPDHQICTYSLWEEVLFGLRIRKLPTEDAEARATRALQSVGLYDMRERHPRELSRGQRQRLAVASVLAMEPDAIVLDEPTTGQDFAARRQIMDLVTDLHKAGRTILMVTHDMALVAEYARRAIVMKDGQVIFDDTPKALFTREDILLETGLTLPPVIALSRGLHAAGLPAEVLTVDELAVAITKALHADTRVQEHLQHTVQEDNETECLQ